MKTDRGDDKFPKGGLYPKNFLESDERYRTLLELLPVGVYRTTPDGWFIEANLALAQIFGFNSIAEFKKVNVNRSYAREKDRAELLQIIETTGIRFSELEMRRKDGKTIWVRDYSRAIPDRSGRTKYYDGIIVDITKEKQAEFELRKVLKKLERSNQERQKMIRKLETLSLKDDLTHLYNRRGFFAIAREHLELANRKKLKMFLLFLDLDNMKAINDNFGHNAGDKALVCLAEILIKTFRRSDIKGRMGGDEFAVFPIDSKNSGVRLALKRLSGNIEKFNVSTKRPFRISVSTGIACYDPAFPCTMDDLIHRADRMMYEHKNSKQLPKKQHR